MTNDQTIPAHPRLDKGDFLWLLYLVFMFIEPAMRNSPLYWLETLGLVAIFVIMYALFLRRCDLRFRLGLLAGMGALGLLSYPLNNGSTCFLIYAASLLPFVLSNIPWVLTAFALQAALLAAEGTALHISRWSWLSAILLIATIGGSNIGFAQRQRADRKLRMKQDEIEALAAVAERERIARDLHDVLGHTLSVIVLKAELASRLLQRDLLARQDVPSPNEVPSAPDDPSFAKEDTSLPRAQAEMAEVERIARSALAEVREAIGGYRARGLAAEIEAARSTLHSAGVALQAEGNLATPGLSAAAETVLALVLREAVTNIVRHARASTCTLRLAAFEGQHQLSIQDNGQHAVAREGNGLRGMRERIEALGGQLSLHREAGTRLTIHLPQTRA